MIILKKLYGTCDIPELQSYNGVCIPVEDLQSEVNTDSGTVMLGKELVNVALDD
jgi:hypothetical protein